MNNRESAERRRGSSVGLTENASEGCEKSVGYGAKEIFTGPFAPCRDWNCRTETKAMNDQENEFENPFHRKSFMTSFR
jgi:hypothetical protein